MVCDDKVLLLLALRLYGEISNRWSSSEMNPPVDLVLMRLVA